MSNIVKKPPLICNVGKNIVLGCDPEVFVQKYTAAPNGSRLQEIVASEEIIPEKGIATTHGKIVRDGIQVELQPTYSYCRQLLANNLRSLLDKLARVCLEKAQKDNNWVYTPITTATVEIPTHVFEKLGEKTKQLGCTASKNRYNPAATVNVDGQTYQWRSAGGHIHFGIDTTYHDDPTTQRRFNRERLVPLCDVIVGNTSVIFDSDPLQAKRRENYGRAGEFREPSYGIEYRTLSNFWISSYPMFSLFTGLAKLAFLIEAKSSAFQQTHPYAEILLDSIDIRRFVEAIDTGNRAMALENLHSIAPFIKRYIGPGFSPVDTYSIDAFCDYAEGMVGNKGYFQGRYFAWENADHVQQPGWEKLFGDLIVPKGTITEARILREEAAAAK